MTVKVSERMLKLITSGLKVDRSHILPGALFISDLGADSLSLVELQMAMEEEFGIEIPEEDAVNIVSLQTAIDYLSSKGIADK